MFYPAFCVFRIRNVYVLVVFRRRLLVGSTNCSSYSLLCFQNDKCLRLCISRFFCRSLSVGSTNCFTRHFVFLEQGMFMYQSFFAGVCRSIQLTVLAIPFCVFKTRNVYVLVVFCWRLSVGSTYCDSYALLCFQNEECLRLCISHFIAGVYRSVRLTVLLPFVFLERGMYICQSSFKCIRRFDKLLIWNRE